MSHPAGMRGLKLLLLVARDRGQKSHPAGMRGLKQLRLKLMRKVKKSHPAGMRGLKQVGYVRVPVGYKVASRRDAWIETLPSYPLMSLSHVASRRDAWIETQVYSEGFQRPLVASRRDAWIETIYDPCEEPEGNCRIPQGCVD